jgi:hypothetical protein
MTEHLVTLSPNYLVILPRFFQDHHFAGGGATVSLDNGELDQITHCQALVGGDGRAVNKELAPVAAGEEAKLLASIEEFD